MSVYPEAVYDPRTKENKTGVEYNAEETTKIFAEDIVKLDDEVVALQTEIGLNPKGDDTDVKARLDRVDEWNGIATPVEILSDSYSIYVYPEFDAYKRPGEAGGWNSSIPVYSYLNPVKITELEIIIGEHLPAGENLKFVLYKDGVTVTDVLEITDSTPLTQSIVCDVTIESGQGLSYHAWTTTEMTETSHAITINLNGETVGNKINCEFLLAQINKFNAKEIVTAVLKTDAVVNNTINYNNVDDLTLLMPSKKYLKFEAVLIFSLQASSDVKYKFNPTGIQEMHIYRREQSITTVPQTYPVDNTILVSTSQKVIEHVQGVIKTGSTPYNIITQFAQNTQQAHNTIMEAGSFISLEILDSYV